MESQMTRKERLAKADDVLLNDTSLEVLYLEIDDLNHKYLQLCQR
jgi:dephospho-CoA kinase